MNDAEVVAHIRSGAKVDWNAPAVLHEMPITFPVSRGGPIYQGTIASCVKECIDKPPRPMVMYSMSIDKGKIEGLPGGLMMQQAIVELAKRDDCPQ